MFTAARISLALALAAVTVAALAAAAFHGGWYDAVANQVRAQPINVPKGPQRVEETPGAVSKTATTPEERLERLVEGVIDLAIEEVGEQMKGQETADAETRRQCDQRREEASRKRRAMYVVFSEEKEN